MSGMCGSAIKGADGTGARAGGSVRATDQ